MVLKLTPRKSNDEIRRIRMARDSEIYEKICEERKNSSVSVFYPHAEEIYLRHVRFFKSIGAKCCCKESKHNPNMVMEFKIDKRVTLTPEQIKEFLTIVKEQGNIIEVAVSVDDKLIISYELINALQERKVR